jgi:hypothetical protein
VLKRIYIKGLSILDRTIGKFHLLLERKGYIKEIPYKIYEEIENSVPVNHKYPVNFEEKDKALFDHCTNYQSANEEIFELENVYVSERGIVFKRFTNFWGVFPHTLFRADYGWLYILKHYLFRKKIVAPDSKKYILLYDFWSSANYYHWLIDSMPRLFVVNSKLKQEKYSLLLPFNCPKYIKATLNYFQISHITYIKKNEYLQAEKVLVPYYLAGSGHIHPVKVKEVIDFFSGKINSVSSKKRIYVSRARQKARRIHNELEVQDLLKKYGFETVFFEDHTFEEQVSMAKNAEIMVSSHGANLTNMMFMPPGSCVMELIRYDKPNFCYWALASVAELNYYYQLCDVVKHDHLLVNIQTLELNLRKMLNE